MHGVNEPLPLPTNTRVDVLPQPIQRAAPAPGRARPRPFPALRASTLFCDWAQELPSGAGPSTPIAWH